METNKWYAVQTVFYDNGRVSAHLVDTFDGEKPEDTFTHLFNRDIYVDWLDNYETAKEMIAAAKSC